ncbi:MAG: hypothetical protein QF689_18395 [Candidatus Latescibacteria bacterium]|jgi:hypothetical protein|nr:hypothetical protein [Candidatus Latescibacterota bacterium]MDP7450561.1 hypothetical protein [Candidatus Latescibacterota bacterium]HJP29945.1 hypothetical protein [Candidatus Latescibacterota bacterium]
MIPVLFFGVAAVVLPSLVLRAIRKRQSYCGQRPDPCIWCRKQCDYYDLSGAE